MGVQALNKTKIIKKHTKHTDRYQSDRFDRVSVSDFILTRPIDLVEEAHRNRWKDQETIQRST